MRGKDDHILVARTTVDLGLQKMAETPRDDHHAIGHGPALRPRRHGRHGDRRRGARMVGGKDYGESQFNRATHAYRQPGSSFKPYVYLTAFETGKYTPNTVVSGGGAACGRWAPKNFAAGESNTMALHDALAHSINTIAVKVSLDVGREKVLETMKKLGITRLKKTCSLALGDQGLTPLEHTETMRSSLPAVSMFTPTQSRRSGLSRAARWSIITTATHRRVNRSSSANRSRC